MLPDGMIETKVYLQKYVRDYLSIECGDYTYGGPIIELAKEDAPRKLRIGRYCSIGQNVRIFVGRQGVHPTDTLTTYPLGKLVDKKFRVNSPKAGPQFRPSQSIPKNLDVMIGNDVWIGLNVIIFAGVTIGDGAILGAGSIVTHDVAAYSIVGGVPAKHISFRHDHSIVKDLLESRWWELDPADIWQRVGDNITSAALPEVLRMLKRLPSNADEEVVPSETASRLNSKEEQQGSSIAKQTKQSPSMNEDEAIMQYWPSVELQQQYTGSSGPLLLQRTKKFVAYLENEGVFNNRKLHILDYGCGWGRISSAIFVRHKCNLTLVDSWEKSLEILGKHGLPVPFRKVPDILGEHILGFEVYNCIFSFSVFTHLSQDAFNQNLSCVAASLARDGCFYFTVRHEDFLPDYNKKCTGASVARVGPVDFYHYSYYGSTYGETIIGRDYINQRYPNVSYKCMIEPLQHLYCLKKR